MVTTAAATSGGRPVCVRRELGGGGAAIQRVASRQPALYQQAVLLQQRVCQRTRLVGCRGVVRSPGRMGRCGPLVGVTPQVHSFVVFIRMNLKLYSITQRNLLL